MKYFSLIYQGDVHPATEEKIIPAKEFSILLEASEILERAREDAEKYQEKVKEECDQLKKDEKKKGFSQGLEEFNEHIIHFDKQIRVLRHELQQQVLQLALRAAKKIVGDQLTLNPETIVDIVIQTITPVMHNRRFVIYVNKVDKEHIETAKPRIKEILDQVQSLTVQERSDIAIGGCVIETESGIINATIENQWRALEAAFEKYAKSQKQN